jgi:CheY-like chemotaxis protein
MPKSTQAGSLRVLVVDDLPDEANTLALLLRLWDHESRVAFDGAGALAVAPEFRPDVVLLDVRMPRLHGAEVARRLRQMPELGGALIVAVSGFYQEADEVPGYDGVFDAFLPKPVDVERLERLLAETAGTQSR